MVFIYPFCEQCGDPIRAVEVPRDGEMGILYTCGCGEETHA